MKDIDKPWYEEPADFGNEPRDVILERARRRQDYVENLFMPIGSGPKKQIEWLVQDFLPKGYLAMLASPPKTGKTCLATASALAVATGTDFAGLPTQQGAVLWIAGEESRVERDHIRKSKPPRTQTSETTPW